MGSGSIDIPPKLKNIVILHVDLDFNEYFDTMAGMDVCIPAFGPSNLYYAVQASSTVAMCIECNVCCCYCSLERSMKSIEQTPILATQRFREAYAYVDDDRVSVTYPAVMTEIDAIKALRTRNASDFLVGDTSGSGITIGSNGAVRYAVEQMMKRGWVRRKKGFEDRKREIWAANDLVAKKLINGMR